MDELTRRARRAEIKRRTIRRRRLTAGGALLGVVILVVVVVFAAGGGDPRGANRLAARRPPPTLPDGSRVVFPRHRVVAFYGAAGSSTLGVLGETPPDQAARLLVRQAAPYRRPRTPVLPAFELIATLSTSSPGDDGNYRKRSSDQVIARYLAAARRAHALLILDIQPGHADFLAEAKAYRKWLEQPDVGLALDSEWSLPRGEVPGQTLGSTDAATVNRVSGWLAGIVARRRLPQKVLLVHQFTPGMVIHRPAIVRRRGLATTINIDGFGAEANKVSKYRELTRRIRFFTGFKLFYSSRMDPTLMTPAQVLALRPQPDIIEYE